MIDSIDKRNPILFSEVENLLHFRVVAKLAFEHLMNEIIGCLSESELRDNTGIKELLSFSNSCFDETIIKAHTIGYFTHHGFESKYILDILEKYRFELKLYEDEDLEKCYSELQSYLEYLEGVYNKIVEIEEVYNEELIFLQN